MRYAIRLFATIPFKTLNAVQTRLLRDGFTVTPVGTNQLDVSDGRDSAIITLDLTDASSDTTRRDIVDFLDRVSRLPDDASKDRVLSTLARTQSIVVIGMPDGDRPADQAVVNQILDVIASTTTGLFHVQGEGFYDGGTLILKEG